MWSPGNQQMFTSVCHGNIRSFAFIVQRHYRHAIKRTGGSAKSPEIKSMS